MKNTNVRLAVLLLYTLCLLSVAYGQVTPSGDAYINTAAPTTSYGSATLLYVNGADETTYIQFDLSAIPTGATITKASLKLYVNAVTKAGSFNVDLVNSTWVEATIDASNAPAPGTTIAASVPLNSANVHDYILIDITSTVQSWLNGTESNNGLALVANSAFDASFDSKENTGTSHPPELDIVFASGVGTITGVTTASGSGLTGGGTSGNLHLSLTPCTNGQVLSWNNGAWSCSNPSGGGTITGVTAGTDLTGGGTAGTVILNLDTTKIPQLASTNTFIAPQTINSSSGIGLYATTSTSSSSGVFGYNSATSGNGNGIYGLANAANGVGVLGANSAATGEAPGVLGESSSSGGTGVYGIGNFAGVAGYTSSSTGYGVFGSNTATSGGGNGVLGQTTTPTGTGVVGINNVATTGFGVYGTSSNTGVYGTGNGSGITGSTSSPTGTGVVGVNTAGGYGGYFQGNVAVTGNFHIGADAPMSSNPRMVFSGFLVGNLGNSPVGGYFVPDRNIVITRVTISENTAGQSCSTMAQVLLVDYDAGNQVYALNLPNNDFAIDSGPLSLPVPGSNRIAIISNAASGCSLGGSSPSDVFVNVQYVMQ